MGTFNWVFTVKVNGKSFKGVTDNVNVAKAVIKDQFKGEKFKFSKFNKERYDVHVESAVGSYHCGSIEKMDYYNLS